MREDLVARNVAKLVRLATPPRAETRILTVDEGRTLLTSTREDRLHAALVLLLVLGLRLRGVGPALAGRQLRRRRAPRPAGVALVGGAELVFTTVVGTPVDPNNFSRTFARWCRDAEVPTVRLHDLRHTCVSMLLTLGVNPRVVMEIVGHVALEMTMDVYAHVAVDEQRSALDKLDGLYD